MKTHPDPDLPALLFLDTEWADDNGRDLASIAIVATDASAYYGEYDPLPSGNDFAQRVLYPCLLRGVFAHSEQSMACSVAEFLALRDCPRVVATHANDFDLLNGLLARVPKAPAYIAELRFSQSLLEFIRTEFARAPDLKARRHNALVDARVLRDAYIAWSTSWGRP